MKSLISKALLCAAFLTAAAFAAPIYRGSFTLPYQAQWGEATLPSGDYAIRFQDIGSRVFIVVKERRTGREVATSGCKVYCGRDRLECSAHCEPGASARDLFAQPG